MCTEAHAHVHTWTHTHTRTHVDALPDALPPWPSLRQRTHRISIAGIARSVIAIFLLFVESRAKRQIAINYAQPRTTTTLRQIRGRNQHGAGRYVVDRGWLRMAGIKLGQHLRLRRTLAPTSLCKHCEPAFRGVHRNVFDIQPQPPPYL